MFQEDHAAQSLSGDVNGDGRADIIRIGMSQDRREIEYFLGKDDVDDIQAQIIEETQETSRTAYHAIVSDFDSDGFDELVVVNFKVGGIM